MATSAAVTSAIDELVVVIGRWTDQAACAATGPTSTAGSPAGAAVASAMAAVHTFLLEQRASRRRLTEVARAFDDADRRRRTSLLARQESAVRLQAARWLLRHPAGGDALRARAVLAATGGHLLRFDPSGDGVAVEVLGDLATADHVVVLVPGMTNDLSNYLSNHRAKALRLLEEMRRQAAPGETVCVVSWLGYDTPDGLVGAAGSALAIRGADALRSDLRLVHAINPRAHLTVLGHSYGSVVVGRAMRAGLDVDDAVVVGSPGMDADDRAELGSPRVQLWASSARFGIRTVTIGPSVNVPGKSGWSVPVPGTFFPPTVVPVIVDPVAFAPGHGEDPSARGFHARRFGSPGARDHSGYFARGTGALANLARIGVGRTPTG